MECFEALTPRRVDSGRNSGGVLEAFGFPLRSLHSPLRPLVPPDPTVKRNCSFVRGLRGRARARARAFRLHFIPNALLDRPCGSHLSDHSNGLCSSSMAAVCFDLPCGSQSDDLLTLHLNSRGHCRLSVQETYLVPFIGPPARDNEVCIREDGPTCRARARGVPNNHPGASNH